MESRSAKTRMDEMSAIQAMDKKHFLPNSFRNKCTCSLMTIWWVCDTHSLENLVMYLFYEAADPGFDGKRSFLLKN